MEKKTKTSKISFKGQLQRVFKGDRQKKGTGPVESSSQDGDITPSSSIPPSAINTGIAISVTEIDGAIVTTPSVPESGDDVQAIVQVPEWEESF